jgi:hypothetical protein
MEKPAWFSRFKPQAKADQASSKTLHLQGNFPGLKLKETGINLAPLIQPEETGNLPGRTIHQAPQGANLETTAIKKEIAGGITQAQRPVKKLQRNFSEFN